MRARRGGSARGWRANWGYAAVFAMLVLLGGWWTVLIATLVEENLELHLALRGADPEVLAAYAAKRRMLVGESLTMSLLVLVLVGGAVAQARRERMQAERLEGVLAASTHELKTPVAGVKALLESLRSGVLPPERAAPHLDRGLESCARLEHLVESIVAYQAAVGRARELEVRALEVWVLPVIEHRRATIVGETLRVDLGEAGSTPVRASVDGLRVVLENLLDNARKYGAGTPTEVRARMDGSRVRLEVRDAGIGFSPEDADALFEPYRRGAENEQRHGTGLGLYISRQLARAMLGELTATSEGPGRGSSFVLHLRRG